MGRIHQFEYMRQYVLAVAVPSALSGLGGAMFALKPHASKSHRFWTVAGVSALAGYTVLRDFIAFIPVIFQHGIPIPNPIWPEGQTIIARTDSWVRGIDIETGEDTFKVDAPTGGHVIVENTRQGIARIRVEENRGIGPEKSVFLDIATGDEVTPRLDLMNPTPHQIASYLYSVDLGVLPGKAKTVGGMVPVFKAKSELWYVHHRWESRQTTGYLGQFLQEGWTLLTSRDPYTGTCYVYMLRPTT